VKAHNPQENTTVDYLLWGVDNFLVEQNDYGFRAHLPYVIDGNGTRMDLRTRVDVWQALQVNDSWAVVDGNVEGGSQFNPSFGGLRVNVGDTVRLTDPGNQSVGAELLVIGVLEQSLPFTVGIFTSQRLLLSQPFTTTRTAYFFELAPGVESLEVAEALESEFFPFGFVTLSLREEVSEFFEISNKVLLLMQAYLAIGLLVGIAGLAIMTLRAVTERRQEIGALRAIGFTQGMIARSFLVEITYVSVVGIVTGIALGIFLAYDVYLVYYADLAVWSIPYLRFFLIGLGAYLLTVLATAAPAIQASRIPPAEALRHAE